jgi:hypothetical protein
MPLSLKARIKMSSRAQSYAVSLSGPEPKQSGEVTVAFQDCLIPEEGILPGSGGVAEITKSGDKSQHSKGLHSRGTLTRTGNPDNGGSGIYRHSGVSDRHN